MIPVSFPEVNKTLGPPVGMTDEECSSLPIFTDGQVCISCWSLTDEEIADVVKKRQLWVWIHSGQTQPPISIETRKPRFG